MAHTEPPNPAPKAEAPMAPSWRALSASHRVSSTIFPKHSSLRRWESEDKAPTASSSRASIASAICGTTHSLSTKNWTALSTRSGAAILSYSALRYLASALPPGPRSSENCPSHSSPRLVAASFAMATASLYLFRVDVVVFFATTPLTPMTKVHSGGKHSCFSQTRGRNEHCCSSSFLHVSMAVWSSEPPKVPTPAPPMSVLQVCPFSIHPRYSHNSASERIARR
mmetsp:Transcript_15762/g.46424  ORF Transcript_15762/g.46424 Transcript_15762/m.46424 type:complete len:225 (-) Transcript_15762:691-1365(-)